MPAKILADNCYAMTCAEVAQVMGCSHGHVHKIERQALAKVRAECKLRGFTFEQLLIGARGDNPYLGHDNLESL
jgi:hypothetical protein